MIGLLLATLGGMIATGFFAAGRQAAGPWRELILVQLAGLLGALHALISNLLMALIIVHITGVAAEWLLTGDNLVKAMFTGRKRLPTEAEVRERPLATAPAVACHYGKSIPNGSGALFQSLADADKQGIPHKDLGLTALQRALSDPAVSPIERELLLTDRFLAYACGPRLRPG